MLIDFALTLLGAYATALVAAELRKRVNLPKIQRRSPYTLTDGKTEFDFYSAPHLIVGGISNMGKSYFVTKLLKGRNDIDITILNAYLTDFQGVKGSRINDRRSILLYLQNVLSVKHNKPQFIVIDEILTLSTDRKIMNQIQELLCVARHQNVYLICITQRGLQSEIPFKNLFNMRVCFKMLETQSLIALLGYSPENIIMLRQGQYYFVNHCATGIAKCPSK